jgi:hypothetical protein
MVRQYDAQNWCDIELRKHKLWEAGWRTNFSKAIRLSDGRPFIAACFHQEKRIVFSIPHLNVRSEAELKQSIIHEIAHAVVGYQHGHDEVWKAKAIELGLLNPTICGTYADLDAGKALNIVETKPESKIRSLNSFCPTCHAVFVTKSQIIMGGKTWMKGMCGHLVSKDRIKNVLDEIDNWSTTDGSKTIYPFQAEGIKFIASANGRALVADEPALGKTVQAIGALYFYKEMRSALWVCKNNLRLQTLKAGIDWCGIEMAGQIIEHGKMHIIPNLNLYIVSMDLLRNIPTEKLEEIPYKTIVADEIQHFKNPESTRTNELRKLVARAEYFIPLSGTPWKNRGSEYFPVLNMLQPEMFPGFRKFKNDWVENYYDEKAGKYREGGIRNIKKFRELTKSFIIRRMRDDVLPDLPKIARNIRFVDMDEESKKHYEKEESKVAAMIKAAMIDDKPMKTIASMIMSLKHITGLAKVPVCIDDVEEWLEQTEDHKLTIFHHHIDVGDNLQNGVKNEYEGIDTWLKSNGYNPSLRLFGGVEETEKTNVINLFKRKRENRVLIASTLASGEGLNIQFCQRAYMLERQWNPQNEEQAEFRFSRPLTWEDYPAYLQELLFNTETHDPKKVSVAVPYFIAAGTVDEILTNIIERKRLNYRKSMNPGDEELQWDENEVIREVAEFIIKKRYKK